MIKRHKFTLEHRISKLEKLLSKKQMKSEGVYSTLLNDHEAADVFYRVYSATMKAWEQLHPLLKDAKKCDNLIGMHPNDGDSIWYILKGVCNDLQTLTYATNVEYNADLEDDEDDED